MAQQLAERLTFHDSLKWRVHRARLNLHSIGIWENLRARFVVSLRELEYPDIEHEWFSVNCERLGNEYVQ